MHEHSVLAGTIFHRTRTPLPIWLEAAWAMLHRHRRAMVFANRTPLTGYVEVDETFVGGHEAGKRGRGAVGKTVVLIAIETLGHRRFGRVRLTVAPGFGRRTLHQYIKDNIECGSTMMTDGLSGYVGIERAGYTHDTSMLRNRSTPAHAGMPGVRLVASLLRRRLLGTHQGRIEPEKLPSYTWMSSPSASTGAGAQASGRPSAGSWKAPWRMRR